ncbi:MAG: hypothetical protein AAF322_19675, partial [Pseudomonadota bacterium]
AAQPVRSEAYVLSDEVERSALGVYSLLRADLKVSRGLVGGVDDDFIALQHRKKACRRKRQPDDDREPRAKARRPPAGPWRNWSVILLSHAGAGKG